MVWACIAHWRLQRLIEYWSGRRKEEKNEEDPKWSKKRK